MRLPDHPATYAVGYVSIMLLGLLVLFFLAGCASKPSEPQIITKEVRVPVPVFCNVDIGPSVVFPDAGEAMANVPDVFTGTKYLKAGRVLRDARIRELEAALEACSRHE
jgi:hypothetical protein